MNSSYHEVVHQRILRDLGSNGSDISVCPNDSKAFIGEAGRFKVALYLGVYMGAQIFHEQTGDREIAVTHYSLSYSTPSSKKRGAPTSPSTDRKMSKRDTSVELV